MNKYNNKKTIVDAIIFDSKDEAKYYELLKAKRAAGEIKNFELQPRFTLKDADKDLKLRKVEYVADFLIYHNYEMDEVVDIKGMATETALLKRKWFMYTYRYCKLTWLCRSLKYGDKDGWIEYDELKKRRRRINGTSTTSI